MKNSYAIINACDKLIVAEETEGSNKLLSTYVGSVALLGLSTIELHTLWRGLKKHKLPDHLKQLAKDVSKQSGMLSWSKQNVIDESARRTNCLPYILWGGWKQAI